MISPSPFQQLAARTNKHEIGNRRLVEGNAVLEEPEGVSALRVTDADVAVAQRAPPKRTKEAVGKGSLALAMSAQLLNGVEYRLMPGSFDVVSA